jgi:hypothetical protein
MSNIRKATMDDVEQIYFLYKTVARSNPGNLTQEEYEITIDYVEEMVKSGLERGFVLVAQIDNNIIGYAKSFTSKFKCLAHILTDGTLMIHPDHQRGCGAKLLLTLLYEIKTNMRHILKFEIYPHKTNKLAVQMYCKLGFKIELSNANKIRNYDGSFGDELLMSWENPNFSQDKLNEYHLYLKELIDFNQSKRKIEDKRYNNNEMRLYSDNIISPESIYDFKKFSNRQFAVGDTSAD